MNRKLLSLLCMITLIFCCAKEDYDTFRLNEPFPIESGETLHNHWQSLSIRFDSLVYDSRCPEGMKCFWEGNASAAFTIMHQNRVNSFSLDTYHGRNFHTDTVLFGFLVKLNALYRDPEFIIPNYPDSDLLSIIPYIAQLEILK